MPTPALTTMLAITPPALAPPAVATGAAAVVEKLEFLPVAVTHDPAPVPLPPTTIVVRASPPGPDVA